MKRLINALTGTEMYVPEARLSEYLAAGHKLAESPAPERREEPKAAATKRKTPAKPKTAKA